MAGVTGIRSRGRTVPEWPAGRPGSSPCSPRPGIRLNRREWRIGNVGERFDAAGQNTSAWPRRDLVGGVVDGLSRRGAGAIEGIGRNAGGELGQETHLARHVRREDRGDHLAEDDLVDLAAVELAAIEQLPRGVAGERDGGHVAEDGAALGERSADAGDDRDPPARATSWCSER